MILVAYSYRFSHLQRTFKALEASTKTVCALGRRRSWRHFRPLAAPRSRHCVVCAQSIKTSDDGLLSIQFLMPLQSIKRPGVKPPEEPQNGFVEFLVSLASSLPVPCLLYPGRFWWRRLSPLLPSTAVAPR